MDAPGIWHVTRVDAEHPPAPDEALKQTWLAHASYSSTNVTRIREHGGIRAHIHRQHDEIIYVVEGEGEFRFAGALTTLAPGDVIVAPAGTVHGPTARSPAFVFLSVFAPEFDPAHPDRVFVEEL